MTNGGHFCYNLIVMEIKNADYIEKLNKNEVISFVPRGDSMWPTLKDMGQSVIISAKKERLKEFDIALYVRGQNTFVLHRVLKVLEDGYAICGDSQFDLEKVAEEQIFGVMIGFYQGKKYIDCKDPKYIKRVKKLYKHAKIRKLKVALYFFSKRVKNKLKRMFGSKKKDV